MLLAEESIFLQLKYWKYLNVRHVWDVMHIEKNMCDSIIDIFFNISGKIKDGLTARSDLNTMDIRKSCWLKSEKKDISYSNLLHHFIS